MVLNDSLASALSHILNCEKIGRKECILRPASNLLLEVLKILNEKGYLGSYEIVKE